METFNIEKDIPCYRLKAGFPHGVLAAHQQLHSLFPPGGTRRYFGISRGDGKNNISYWAAVERMDGDDQPGLETFTIPAGTYIGRDIKDFKKDITSIGETFRQLLTDPFIDPNGFCLEWYYNMNDVRCMVPVNKSY